MSEEQKTVTIEEFLASLPEVQNVLEIPIGGLVFRFEAPMNFEHLVAVFSHADRFALASQNLPEGEMKRFSVSRPIAREIGLMKAMLKYPAWEELDLMKLACQNGHIYGDLRTAFDKWLENLGSQKTAQEVVAEKKDSNPQEPGSS